MMNNDKAKVRVKDFAVKALCFLTVAFAAMPATSIAQQLGYTSKNVNLRAGPSMDYPVVVTVPAGISLTVIACLQGYQWCDVAVGPNRGWMYAGNIVYPYQGSNVPVLTYGSRVGIGITAFSVGSYWDDYYTAYPWYPQRQNWINRPWSGYGYGYAPGAGRYVPRAQVRPVVPRLPQAQAPRSGQRVPPAQVRPVDPRP